MSNLFASNVAKKSDLSAENRSGQYDAENQIWVGGETVARGLCSYKSGASRLKEYGNWLYDSYFDC